MLANLIDARGRCDCDLCNRNQAFELALYTGNVRDAEDAYDSLFESAGCLEMDLAFAVSQLQLIQRQPERAVELAAGSLRALRIPTPEEGTP